MPYARGTPLRDRLEIGFVEADVEIGFNLVDLAAEPSNSSLVARILGDAADVLDDIDRRLTGLGDADRASFDPLVAELRRELDQLKTRNAPRPSS
jgi:hypothetical protein